MTKTKVYGLAGVGIALVAGAIYAWRSAERTQAEEQAVFAKGVSDVPFASTRGYFKSGILQEGHLPGAYDIGGKLPGIGGPAATEVFVIVHGLNNDQIKAENRFALARESLQHAGYKGVVVGWSWDGSTNRDPFGATGYREAKKNAIGNGPSFAAFLRYLAKANPGAKLRLVGYSMGARVVLEGLKTLDCTEPRARIVESVHLVGAAIDNEEPEKGERYGAAIEAQCATFFNYFSPHDDKLGIFFPLRDADRALGRDDIEHPERKPHNYRSKNVETELKPVDAQGRVDPAGTVGKNHSGYLGIRDDDGVWRDDGVMDVVVRDISLPNQ